MLFMLCSIHDLLEPRLNITAMNSCLQTRSTHQLTAVQGIAILLAAMSSNQGFCHTRWRLRLPRRSYVHRLACLSHWLGRNVDGSCCHSPRGFRTGCCWWALVVFLRCEQMCVRQRSSVLGFAAQCRRNRVLLLKRRKMKAISIFLRFNTVRPLLP
jgi:hypothetical protein